MSDPTYVREQIDANPAWKLAWRMSEVDNDNAPVGWARYISLANWLIRTFKMQEAPLINDPARPLTPATRRWTEVLCMKCGGNGVLKIIGGVTVCPRCEGRCYEPDAKP